MTAQRTITLAATLAAIALASFLAVRPGTAAEEKPATAAPAQPASERVFEMRIYTAAEGKFDAMHARFRDHTSRLFRKHGMEIVAYWVPLDGDKARNTLIYVLAYPDRESARRSWEAFSKDPEWQKARAESEKDGKLVAKVESIYMRPTDYSPMK